jgi:hypothetical protein
MDMTYNMCNTVSCQNPYPYRVTTKIRHFDIQDLVAYLITLFVKYLWLLVCLN